LRFLVKQAGFKQILREWSRLVKESADPLVFANMYLERIRDPLDIELRTACSMFITFTRTRSWDELLEIIGPKLDRDVLKIFRKDFAVDFYEGWKAMVIEQIRAYWEDFLAVRKAKSPGPKDWSPIGKYKLKG